MPNKYEFTEQDRKIFGQLASTGYQPATVFDVGASQGYWSWNINQVFPNAHYHLFEPLAAHLPKYANDLRKNLEANQNFTLHEVALGAERRAVTMGVMPDGYSSSVHWLEGLGMHQHTVEMWRLDDYVAAHRLATPNVLKLDVQGSEDAILRGAGTLLDAIDVIHVEAWFVRGYGPATPLLHELHADLTARSFVLVDLADCYYTDRHELISVDAIFLASRLVDRLPTW